MTHVDIIRARIQRALTELAERTRAANLVAAGRVAEARKIVAQLRGPFAAVEVYRSPVHINYASPVHSRFDVTDTEVES